MKFGASRQVGCAQSPSKLPKRVYIYYFIIFTFTVWCKLLQRRYTPDAYKWQRCVVCLFHSMDSKCKKHRFGFQALKIISWLRPNQHSPLNCSFRTVYSLLLVNISIYQRYVDTYLKYTYFFFFWIAEYIEENWSCLRNFISYLNIYHT